MGTLNVSPEINKSVGSTVWSDWLYCTRQPVQILLIYCIGIFEPQHAARLAHISLLPNICKSFCVCDTMVYLLSAQDKEDWTQTHAARPRARLSVWLSIWFWVRLSTVCAVRLWFTVPLSEQASCEDERSPRFAVSPDSRGGRRL